MPTNPYSTGGGGSDFERRVATAFVCHSVAGLACPPQTAPPTAIWLQAGHLGCKLDDVVLDIEVDKVSHQSQRAFLSVKSTIRLTPSDGDFREVMQAAWADFHNLEVFNPQRDFLGLVVAASRTSQIGRLIRLTELARACKDAADFENRLGLKRYIDSRIKALHHDIIAVIRQGNPGHAPDAEAIYRLLRCFHASAFDLDQDVSHDRARTIGMLTLASRGENQTSGENCWNDIFQSISLQNAKAKHFARPELEEIAAKHGIRRDTEQQGNLWLSALRDHCRQTRQGISAVLGTAQFHFERTTVRSSLRDAFDESRVVLVSGPAGSGKSALAIEAAEAFAGSAQVFCFASEEFAHPHLDTALQAAGLKEILVSEWAHLFPLRPRVLVVESVERLLEHMGSREAFNQLLREVRSDARWHVILTCRDYLADHLRTLEDRDFPWRTVEVPLLDPAEVKEATARTTIPSEWLVQPVVLNALRNLKWLDLTLKASEQFSRSTASDSTFSKLADWRRFVWTRFLYSGASVGQGRAREELLVSLAVTRVTTATVWFTVEESKRPAAESLVGLNLLRQVPLHPDRFQFDHDLIEDWALLYHVERRFDDAHDDPTAFFTGLGENLIILRAFRHFFGEFLDGPRQAQGIIFIQEVMMNAAIPKAWREATVIALLGSRNAFDTIEKTLPLWTANGYAGFHLLVHCLRVAFLGRPLSDEDVSRPFGPGWAAILKFIDSRDIEFLKTHARLTIEMLLDWRHAVRPESPEPPGLKCAAALVRKIWTVATESDERFERLFGEENVYRPANKNVLAWLVAACAGGFDEEFFQTIVTNVLERPDRAQIEGRQRYRQSVELVEYLTADYAGWALGRAFPHVMLGFCERSYGLEPPPRPSRYGSSGDDHGCGLATSRMDFTPPSALRGPFLALLRYHPEAGERFILRLTNEAIARYSSHPPQNPYIQPVVEISLDLDGNEITQLADEGWWRCYRGWSPYPHVLECSLMALEKWLLEDVAVKEPEGLEGTLCRLIQGSHNVAITAVAASVANVHPSLCGKVAVVLLKCPELIHLDRRRWMNDQTQAGWGGGWGEDNYIYVKERLRANELTNRKESVEQTILKAQFGPARPEIWAVLDQYYDDLNKEAGDEPEYIKVFRLLLHRIDARNLVAQPTDDGTNRILLSSKLPAEDLQQFVDEEAAEMEVKTVPMNLNVWASQILEPIGTFTAQPERWREMLAKAQSMTISADDQNRQIAFGGTPALVAAVCVRDFWAQMTSEEQAWCIQVTTHNLLKDESLTVWQSGSFLVGSREESAAAHAVGRLCLLLKPEQPEAALVRSALAVALTHPENRIALDAGRGFGSSSNSDVRRLQLAACELVMRHARICRSVDRKYRGPGTNDYLNWLERQAAMHDDILAETQRLRQRFVAQTDADERALSLTYPRGFEEDQGLAVFLALIAQQKTETAKAMFLRAMKWVAVQWCEERGYRGRLFGRDEWRGDNMPRTNPVTVGQVSYLVANYMLSLSPTDAVMFLKPLLTAIRIVRLRGKRASY